MAFFTDIRKNFCVNNKNSTINNMSINNMYVYNIFSH